MNTARLNQGTPLLLNAVSKHYAENIVLNHGFHPHLLLLFRVRQ